LAAHIGFLEERMAQLGRLPLCYFPSAFFTGPGLSGTPESGM